MEDSQHIDTETEVIGNNERGKSDPNTRIPIVVRKRIQSAKQIYEKNYLLSIIQFKQKHFGFYDVPCHLNKLGDDVDNNKQSETSQKDIDFMHNCFICFESFDEGDDVAVHTGCQVPHPLHTGCFNRWCCETNETPTEEAGPDTLILFRRCFCNRQGTWKQWRYSCNTSNWTTGSVLPDKQMILAIHEHKDKNSHFRNFIISEELLYAIKTAINNTSFVMEKPIGKKRPTLLKGLRSTCK